uniref:NBS-LRR disease resistance protein n=1 Tax=Dasypyrum villosum TaxID=40247 RepID=A0A8K1IBD6_9POAL|nr:NBS-LRR disease resistance protein [Dasypyrum villosum]
MSLIYLTFTLPLLSQQKPSSAIAMVLDAFASYLADLLTQVDTEELGMLIGASDEIDKMGNKLHDLRNFLADADRRKIGDKSIQEWVGQLKRAMHEAADVLDLCHLNVVESGTSHVNIGCFDPLLFCMQNFRGCLIPLLFCMQNPSHAHDISTRIKALNQRLDTIKEQSVAFGFINLGSNEYHSSHMHFSHRGNPSWEMSGDPDRFGVVGEKIEEDTKSLVAQIMQAGNNVNNNIMVFAIVGIGGVGKTTLAQKVFNDKAIQAVIEAGGDHWRAGNTKTTLHQTLKDSLIGHKTLLVMDDVWDHGAWEGVIKVPFNAAASGSRVLITTRDEGVALGMIATRPYHHVNTLAPDEAWLLLKKQVLSSDIDENHINMLKDIGLKIIQKIGGLPLSIKLMGGLLRQREGLHCYWEKVLDDSKWLTAEMPRELSYAVYLSYEDMPSYLRQCFLYYSLLPKCKKFHVAEVVAMWISEGFIHGSLNDLEESGRYYYNELISRNLIEPDKSYFDQSYCSMHDLVRSFAQYMMKDEALIVHNEDINILAKLNSQKFLRLSIEANILQSGEIDWQSMHKQHVRTLISAIHIKMKHGDSLANFSCLRVLHIESTDVATLLESLHQLKHLRYLALINTDISVLPGNIGNMKLLQFLNLCGCTQLVDLPDNIVNLGQLRLLSIPRIRMIPRGFCGLTSMRRLHGFRAHMDGDWCSLEELGPLSQLKLLKVIQLESEWEWEEQVEAMPHLDELLLCNCRLRCVPLGLASNARALKKLIIQDIQHLSYLENFPLIVDLTLLGSPDLERITNFPNLQKLTITDCPKLIYKTRHFQLFCRLWLLRSVAAGQSGSRVGTNFSHMEHVKAYADDEN